MREYRTLQLPRMSRRNFLIASAGLLMVCGVAGTGMRSSLTDFNSDKDELDALGYRLSPATKGIVSLYGAQSVIEEMRAEGIDSFDYSVEEARKLLTMPGDDVDELAPVILTGTFTGERTYVYEAFKCLVKVNDIIKGECLTSGDSVVVYDPYAIQQPGFYSNSGGIFTDMRVVCPTADCLNNGMAPLREGQEYLFFLEPKRFPDDMNVPNRGRIFLLVNHTYARVPIDVADHPERIEVIDISTLETIDHGTYVETVMPDMTFSEACQYDVFVQDEEAAHIYRLSSAAILGRVLDA